MSPADRLQAWTVAYALAYAVTALGSEIRGARNSPQDIDQRAQALADKAVETIAARETTFRR